MTFEKRHTDLIEERVNSIADLKELADYHSSTSDLFRKSAPFMNPQERETVSDNQHQLGQSIDKKWSDRFDEPQNNNVVPDHTPAPTPAPTDDLLGDVASPDSVNGPVAGLSDLFG